jgi:hypothetical protein
VPQHPSAAPDLIEEFRLRRWARLNYVPAEQRGEDLHPIVLNEMLLRDEEQRRLAEERSRRAGIVPLLDSPHVRLHGPHSAETGAAVTSENLSQSAFYYS